MCRLTRNCFTQRKIQKAKGLEEKYKDKNAAYSMDFSHNVSSDLYSSAAHNWTRRVQSDVSKPEQRSVHGPDKHLFFTTITWGHSVSCVDAALTWSWAELRTRNVKLSS